MDYWKDSFEVGASGDFGDDATIGGENVNLRNDYVAEDFTVVRNNRGGGFVTRRFDG